MALTRNQLVRYARHLALRDVGLEGQERLGRARILLVGAGGLGSPAALYLAAAGVGELGLCDFDEVELANLHRQVLHGTPDIGRTKAESAADRLGAAAGRSLYLASSSEPELARLTSRLAGTLARQAGSSVRWHHEKMPQETHATIYHPAALRALRHMFAPPPAQR